MGGGDLNLKKEWHPATFKNQEDVWKREQAVLAEQKKLEQLQKEKEEERLREEIERAQPGGRKRLKGKLDWMYSQGHSSNATSFIDEDKEAFLLGKKRVDAIVKDKPKEGKDERWDQERFKDKKASIYGVYANSARDIQAKVRDDPLLAFKRQEQASLQAVLSNPLRLKQLKEAKKKEKKAKKNREEPDEQGRKHDISTSRRSRSPKNYSRRSRSPDVARRSRYSPRLARSRTPPRNSGRFRSPVERRSRSPVSSRRRSPIENDAQEKLEQMKRNASKFREERNNDIKRREVEEEREKKREMERRNNLGDRGSFESDLCRTKLASL